MPKSKTRKNHKQKVQARNTKILNEKKAAKKQQTKILEKLIQMEQASGKFDNNKTFGDDLIIGDLNGPQI